MMDKKKIAYALTSAVLMSWSLALLKLWLFASSHSHFTNQVSFNMPQLWKAVVYYILPFKG